jgi:hypothetical protein
MRVRETAKQEADIANGETLVSTACGTRVGRRLRIGGWGSEYRNFVAEVSSMVKTD